SICRESNSRSICLSEILQARRRLRRSRRRIWRSDLFYQLVSLLLPPGGLFDLRRLSIFVCHPAIPGTDEERNKLADRFGILVFFPNAVRIGAAPPLAKNDDVSGSVLVDKNLMRHIAFKATHVRPHFTRETESLFFRTGLEPGVPNDRDHPFPPYPRMQARSGDSGRAIQLAG